MFLRPARPPRRRLAFLACAGFATLLFAANVLRRPLVARWRGGGADAHPEIPALPEPTSPPLVETRTLASGRTYLAVSPSGAPVPKLPIVLVLHGDGGDSESMRTFTGFDRATDRAAHVAFVTSGKQYWRHHDAEGAYLKAVIADLAASRAADASRVFLFGWSSGAYLTQRFACDNPAVVAVALCEGRGHPRCAHPKPTLVLHNSDDDEHTIASGDALADGLRHAAGCTDATPRVMPWDPSCVSYQGCARHVAYCRVDGGSHYPWKHAARVAWAFFTASGAPSE